MNAPGTQTYWPPDADGGLGHLLYLPPAFEAKAGRRWPVLCFLHGIGEAAIGFDETEQGWPALLKHGAPPWHCQLNSPFVRDFIVFSPQLPERRRWNAADLDVIAARLGHIHAELAGDPRRTFLTGFSIGGKATLDFAAGAGGVRFSALWPVDDAAPEPRETCDAARIWLYFGAWRPGPQQRSADTLGLAPSPPFEAAEPASQRRYTSYAGLDYDHTATCVAAYADWRPWRWLLAG